MSLAPPFDASEKCGCRRWIRRAAVASLGGMGRAAVSPVIEFVRAECARVGVPRFMDEELPETLQGAAAVLRALRGAAADALIDGAAERDTMVRRVSVGVLAALAAKPPEVIRALRRAEDDPDVVVSYLARTGLRR